MIIRQELLKDYDNVHNVVKLAFETAEYTDKKEHFLVDKLRSSSNYIKELSLVAEDNGTIIGHILFTRVKIGIVEALSLAPLSVLPGEQNKGIGSTLIEEGHRIAKSLGYDIVVVLGNPKYYFRKGYMPAKVFGIKSSFEVPDENFMAISLSNSTKQVNGIVEYAKEMFEV